MAGHTPGPWRVSRPQGMYGFEVIAGDRLVCQMTPYVYREEGSEENAYLIAAVPTLLTELEKAARRLDDAANLMADVEDARVTHEMAEEARAAIRAAHGVQ